MTVTPALNGPTVRQTLGSGLLPYGVGYIINSMAPQTAGPVLKLFVTEAVSALAIAHFGHGELILPSLTCYVTIKVLESYISPINLLLEQNNAGFITK